MADVTCPLCSEDLDALLADEQLPSELAAVFELSDGYEVNLTDAEARALLAWAKRQSYRQDHRSSTSAGASAPPSGP
jgi:hypothetical protein